MSAHKSPWTGLLCVFEEITGSPCKGEHVSYSSAFSSQGQEGYSEPEGE